MYLVLGSGIEKINDNSIFDSFGYFRIDDTRCVVAKPLVSVKDILRHWDGCSVYMKKEHLLKTIHLKHHTSFFLIVGHCNVEQEFNSDFKKIPRKKRSKIPV